MIRNSRANNNFGDYFERKKKFNKTKVLLVTKARVGVE